MAVKAEVERNLQNNQNFLQYVGKDINWVLAENDPCRNISCLFIIDMTFQLTYKLSYIKS